MAFPSKYEGFGLPIVEAWACGTPVLTADNSSLKEIGGDAVILVNADSDKSIADGMKKILTDEKILAEYREKGMKRLELYRWENSDKKNKSFKIRKTQNSVLYSAAADRIGNFRLQ